MVFSGRKGWASRNKPMNNKLYYVLTTEYKWCIGHGNRIMTLVGS